MNDRLIELGEDVKSTPNDMELGDKIRHKNWNWIYDESSEGSDIETIGFEFPTEGKWIYESPDGGNTIYRRKAGDYDNKEQVDTDGNPIPTQMELFE